MWNHRCMEPQIYGQSPKLICPVTALGHQNSRKGLWCLCLHTLGPDKCAIESFVFQTSAGTLPSHLTWSLGSVWFFLDNCLLLETPSCSGSCDIGPCWPSATLRSSLSSPCGRLLLWNLSPSGEKCLVFWVIEIGGPESEASDGHLPSSMEICF